MNPTSDLAYIQFLDVKGFLLKVPEGMLELWRDAATERKTTLSQLIREAVNRDIEKKPKDG